jgi:hypothetical protein
MSDGERILPERSVTSAGCSTNEKHPEVLSCVTCRARKLRCDREKPTCARCAKLNSECVYPESRRKAASKRRNVRELEARLGMSAPHSTGAHITVMLTCLQHKSKVYLRM